MNRTPESRKRQRTPFFSLLATVLLVLIASLHTEAKERKSAVEVQMRVKPRICILSSDSERCEEFLHIHWKAGLHRSICLFEQAAEEPIQCWHNSSEGSAKLAVETNESMFFELRESNNTLSLLATAEFKVVHDNKKYRRSRRNPWSFF